MIGHGRAQVASARARRASLSRARAWPGSDLVREPGLAGQRHPQQVLGRVGRRPGHDRMGMGPVELAQAHAVEGDPGVVRRELQLSGRLAEIHPARASLLSAHRVPHPLPLTALLIRQDTQRIQRACGDGAERPACAAYGTGPPHAATTIGNVPATVLRPRMPTMPEFAYTDLLPVGEDTTRYRLLTADGVARRSALGREFLEVDPEVLTLLAWEGMRDIAHLLRPGHLRQLRSILEDPEASANDRFVARELLTNACISAGGVLPMCQDTGTAIIMGKRGGEVLTDGRDEEHLARGVYDAYTRLNLRYSQLAPLTMWDERNTGSNLPAQIELYATPGAEYKLLLMAKGGGSANKSFLYQQTKAVLNEASMVSFLTEKIGSLGTAACPPYHLAIVVGGTSAEYALKTAKYASARYLDTLPTSGSMDAHGFRDLDLEQQVLEITRRAGIGAQFGGKYFCHDVRVIRLPRHGASCPVAIAVSCSADRQARAKINGNGVFLEQLETDPAR